MSVIGYVINRNLSTLYTIRRKVSLQVVELVYRSESIESSLLNTDIALQVLDEVIRSVIVKDTADAVLVVIERDEGVVAPSFTQNLGAVERVGVLDASHRLARPDTVGVVGIGIAVKAMKLSALFPRQRVSEVGGRVALYIHCNTQIAGCQ